MLVKDLPEMCLIALKILMRPGVRLLIMLVDDLPGLEYIKIEDANASRGEVIDIDGQRSSRSGVFGIDNMNASRGLMIDNDAIRSPRSNQGEYYDRNVFRGEVIDIVGQRSP